MTTSAAKSLRVFLPFALGYFLSYLFRVINAILAPNLAADIGVDPSELGLLTGTYFITFAAFQLPLGVLLDRFGPRKVEAILLFFAAAGALIFANATTLSGLVIGRGLIGLGVSACLMAAFKAFVVWFPAQQLPRINGFQLAAGGLGAITATTPVEMALSVTDWRGVFTALAVITLAVAIVIFIIVPEKKTELRHPGLGEQIRGAWSVFKSLTFWRIAPLAITSQSTFLSVQSLWAGPWLRDIAGMDRTEIARVLLLIYTAIAFGYATIGMLTVRLNRIGISSAKVAITGIVLFALNFLLIILQFEKLAAPLWTIFGFLGTSGTLIYAVLSQRFPGHLIGRVNTLLNLMIFVFSFSAQWATGVIINLWPVTSTGGYAPQGYRIAFSIMFFIQLFAFAWFWLSGRILKNDQTPLSESQQDLKI